MPHPVMTTPVLLQPPIIVKSQLRRREDGIPDHPAFIYELAIHHQFNLSLSSIQDHWSPPPPAAPPPSYETVIRSATDETRRPGLDVPRSQLPAEPQQQSQQQQQQLQALALARRRNPHHQDDSKRFRHRLHLQRGKRGRTPSPPTSVPVQPNARLTSNSGTPIVPSQKKKGRTPPPLDARVPHSAGPGDSFWKSGFEALFLEEQRVKPCGKVTSFSAPASHRGESSSPPTSTRPLGPAHQRSTTSSSSEDDPAQATPWSLHKALPSLPPSPTASIAPSTRSNIREWTMRPLRLLAAPRQPTWRCGARSDDESSSDSHPGGRSPIPRRDSMEEILKDLPALSPSTTATILSPMTNSMPPTPATASIGSMSFLGPPPKPMEPPIRSSLTAWDSTPTSCFSWRRDALISPISPMQQHKATSSSSSSPRDNHTTSVPSPRLSHKTSRSFALRLPSPHLSTRMPSPMSFKSASQHEVERDSFDSSSSKLGKREGVDECPDRHSSAKRSLSRREVWAQMT